MNIYTKQVKIGSCPAYDVFKREVDPRAGAINITTSDTLGLKVGSGDRTFYRRYSPGSCASYALQYNECPITAHERAIKSGHKTHWLSQNSTVIADCEFAREQVIEVEIGQKVFFEGRLFVIASEPNNNLGLLPVESDIT